MVKLSVDKVLLKARAHLKRGEILVAEDLYKNILKAFPTNKKAKQGLANIKKSLRAQTNLKAPQETIENLVRLYNTGQLDLVIEKAQEITKIHPETFMAWNILGVAAARAKKLDQAVYAFQKVTLIKPDYPDGYYNMGNAFKDQGKLEEAVESYKKAISRKLDYPEAYYNMGTAYKNQDKTENAIQSFQRAIKLKPDYVEAHNNLGNVFQVQGNQAEAVISYKKAISIMPDHAKAHKNMGNALGEQGKLDEAIAAFEKALLIKPNYAEAHRNLSSLIKYKFKTSQVKLVSKLLEHPGLEDVDRCHLNYAYAKMNEDLGNLGAAFENYVSGGEIRQKVMEYDRKRDESFFEKTKTTLSKLQQIDFDSGNEPINLTPIFILGMPRSGTTLVEQIISSHCEVRGAGELKDLGQLGGMISLGNQAASQENLLKVRKSYLQKLSRLSGGKKFVTDKMPQNFLYIGLISTILPEAKIIHVRRDPAATCWSNFKHYFAADGLGYSYNLKDTVRYFKLYQDLMNFWDKTVDYRFYDLNYESLTTHQEQETKRLIEYLELDWDEACLAPQKNKRNISTASQLQIRKKVYKGSSDVWRKFRPHLNGVFDEFTKI
jgi:tetratricopeptide (TPR) repeat protein